MTLTSSELSANWSIYDNISRIFVFNIWAIGGYSEPEIAFLIPIVRIIVYYVLKLLSMILFNITYTYLAYNYYDSNIFTIDRSEFASSGHS
jgi:hypothetical protein